MRLLTYNIHKGIGGRDRLYRFERILDVIEEQNPDLICLQEVDRNVRRSRNHDQPHLFVQRFTPNGWLYQMNVHLKEGGYGNLLLSRWPITSHHQISLRYQTNKPRGAQMAVIDSPEGPFHVVNCHLGLTEGMRRWQVRHLLQHNLFKEAAQLPNLIVGDTNDWRNTLEQAIFKEFGFAQITHPPSKFRSFPAYLPLGSLDKAFFRGNFQVKHAHIVHGALARAASDHLPLVIDFHLGGTPAAGVAVVAAGAHPTPPST